MAQRTRRTTIHDVARLANVSAGTVSRVLRGGPGVGDETRARIQALIRELGYQPSRLAQNLASNRSWAVGLVFPQTLSDLFSQPIFPDMVGGLGDSLADAGYSLTLLPSSDGCHNERVLTAVSRRQIDGAVLPDVRLGDDIVQQLCAEGVPFVVIGSRFSAPEVLWIDTDHDEAVRQLTRMLIRAGHRRIALVNGPPDCGACALRAAGFRAALAEHGLRADPALCREGRFSVETGLHHTRELLALPADRRPTAVVAGSDFIAAGCLRAAEERGLRVPDDLAITGFDDNPLTSLVQPPLTTVRMPIREMSRAAAAMLVARLQGDAPPPQPLVLPSEVIVRASSGTPPRGLW